MSYLLTIYNHYFLVFVHLYLLNQIYPSSLNSYYCIYYDDCILLRAAKVGIVYLRRYVAER